MLHHGEVRNPVGVFNDDLWYPGSSEIREITGEVKLCLIRAHREVARLHEPYGLRLVPVARWERIVTVVPRSLAER